MGTRQETRAIVGALASYNAETYNRQLHIDEIKWIKENAKRFAQEESERLGHQVTEQEAMERLITQAAQEVDYAWFKKIGETDGQAQSFLRKATAQGDVPPYDNRGTFINSDGKRQSMFTVADKDEYYSTGKYSNTLAQFDKANGHVVTKTLQPKVKYDLYTKSLSDGADAALKGTLHAFDHPEDVLKPIGFGIANCLKEDMCISAGKEMLSDSGKAVWQSGKDILGSGYHLDDVNYLYGKNMVNEIDAIAAVRGGTALLELAPTVSVAGKTMKWIGGKWVRLPDVDYSRDNANLGKNNPKFNSDFNNNINTKPLAPKAIVKINGYYYADGMKISESYYDKLWTNGRKAPFIQAREIINGNPKITLDERGKKDFYRYESNGLEMIYNPRTKEIWHIQPVKGK